MLILAEISQTKPIKMRRSLFYWFLLVALACGAGATTHHVGVIWIRILILSLIAIVGAFISACAEYETANLYDNEPRIMRTIYVATAVIATWPLLACVVAQSTYLTEVAVTTIPLIGVCINRTLQTTD